PVVAFPTRGPRGVYPRLCTWCGGLVSSTSRPEQLDFYRGVSSNSRLHTGRRRVCHARDGTVRGDVLGAGTPSDETRSRAAGDHHGNPRRGDPSAFGGQLAIVGVPRGA